MTVITASPPPAWPEDTGNAQTAGLSAPRVFASETFDFSADAVAESGPVLGLGDR